MSYCEHLRRKYPYFRRVLFIHRYYRQMFECQETYFHMQYDLHAVNNTNKCLFLTRIDQWQIAVKYLTHFVKFYTVVDGTEEPTSNF